MAINHQQLLIAGAWTPASDGATYESLDPYSGEPATRAAAATVADVDRAADAAHKAFAG